MKYRDEPCTRCGWRFPGFHVCVDLSTPIESRIQAKHNNAHKQDITPEHRERLAMGLSERWQRHRDETAGRDRQIVQIYNEGQSSIKNIAERFGIAFQTTRNVLLRAEMKGETVIRTRGHNVGKAGSDGVRQD